LAGKNKQHQMMRMTAVRARFCEPQKPAVIASASQYGISCAAWGGPMRRRDFITAIVGSAAWPLAARAQQTGQVRLVGLLTGLSDSDPVGKSLIAAFHETLAKLGWTEKNLKIEVRFGAADKDRINSFAKELADLRPDAIFAHTTPATLALARETATIPIVFITIADPISGGMVANVAHPRGNLTGFTIDDPAMGGKWVELLKEIAPRMERVALFFNPATAVPTQMFMPSIQAAASSLVLQVNAAPVHSRDEIEQAIAAQARDPGGGLVIMPDVFSEVNRDLIIALAVRYGVPAIYFNAVYFADSGALITYGSNYFEKFRQVAEYIDRILKGAKPADLPVQSPTKFELVVNLKAAKAIGLEVPTTLIARADRVIE
jgi:putative tryptophan/tyrosine transport system substrate-binding protein